MKVQVLASGSKGNCTYIETENTKLLIDAGINYPRLKNELEKINVNPDTIDAMVISHTHKDHISGLSSITKKTNLTVFIKRELLEEVRKVIPIDRIEIIDDSVNIKDLHIDLINASHDVPAFGFILDDGKNSAVYLTDTGYINRKYFSLTKNKTIYIIESNHDEKMLMEGKYPYILKQRVISDKGHLSNSYTARYLNKTIGNNTKYIILAHISENNNTPELAYSTVSTLLKENNFDEKNIIIAKQYEETEMVEV